MTDSPYVAELSRTLDSMAESAVATLEAMALHIVRQNPDVNEICSAQGSDSVTLVTGETLDIFQIESRFPDWAEALRVYAETYRSGSPGVIVTRATVEALDAAEAEAEAARPSFSSFATEHGIKLTAQNIPFRPERDSDSTWGKTAIHFAVTLTLGTGAILWQGNYSCGAAFPVMWAQAERKKAKGSRLGWLGENGRNLVGKLQQSPNREPWDLAEVRARVVERFKAVAPLEVAGILESLQCDWRGVLDSSFDDWAADFGFDPDSRAAESMFKTCQAGATAARAAIGRAAFAAFLDIESE